MAIRLVLAALMAAGALFTPGALAEETAAKQPVFLLCPHREKYSAWSIYLSVDSGNPAKVLGLGLEKLSKQNSKDLSYEAVLDAQKNPAIARESIGTLAAKDFTRATIDVSKNDALHVGVTPLEDGSLRLMVSMRISADDRFNIGGKAAAKRDVLLRYNKESKVWEAVATALVDTDGKRLADASHPVPISGIKFPVGDGAAGITVVVGVINGGEQVLLLDK